jgi:hypothetical protein
VLAALSLTLPLNAQPASSTNTKLKSKPNSERVAVQKKYGKLPMSFEVNEGQTDPRVSYLTRGQGYQMFFEADRATMRLNSLNQSSKGRPYSKNLIETHAKKENKAKSTVLSMNLIGANKAAKAEAMEKLPGVSNYFMGNDKSKWHSGIANYAKIKFNSIYPGIDIVYYGNQGSLEHDFVVAPGANPETIKLAFDGVKNISIDKKGQLVLKLEQQGKSKGNLLLTSPVLYQMVDGKKVNVAGRYAMKGKNQVGFKVASYDKSRPLTIDPVLVYSTYLGGTKFDQGNGIAVLNDEAYIVGSTNSVNFPGGLYPSGQPRNGTETTDVAFVTKLSSDGSSIVYSTLLGSPDANSEGYAITVSSLGQAFVAGSTNASNFPLAGTPYDNSFNGFVSAWVARLNPSGVEDAATFLGGTTTSDFLPITVAYGIVLQDGTIYVTGFTTTNNFPTVNPFQTAQGGVDAFVTNFNAALSSVDYSTYLGGSSDDYGFTITVNTNDEAYVGGQTNSSNFPTTGGAAQTVLGGNFDGYYTRLNSSGNNLVYSTYIGGVNYDAVYGIAHRFFDAYVTGETFSPDFPVTAGAYKTAISSDSDDAFVARINSGGDGLADLIYSTYVGGKNEDWGESIAVDFQRNAYVGGGTGSSNMFAHPSLPYGGGFDGYALKLLPNGNALAFAIYLGGSSDDWVNGITNEHTGFNAQIYVTGQTYSVDYPTLNAVQGSLNNPPFVPLNMAQVGTLATFSDAFVTKLVPSIPPNHVLLYGINSLLPGQGVDASGITLKDRFQEQFNLEVEGPFELGNPVSKIFEGETGIEDETLHYLTYFISRPCEFSQRITAQNQFHDALTVVLDEDSLLMVPASKNFSLQPPSDDKSEETHFRCYYARAHQFQNPAGLIDSRGNLVNPLSIQLDDQFLDDFFGFTVIRPTRYCVAVEKWHDGVLHDADIQDSENGFMCYQVQPVEALGTFSPFTTLDQFGPGTWTTNEKGYTLCVPSIITSH